MSGFTRGRVVVSLGACAGLFGPAWALAGPPTTDYRLVFADEFNGTSLDTTKWSAASPGWTMPNSLSTATASDVSVGGGQMVMSATRPGTAATFHSGSVSTYGKYNFTGGYVEARIDLPSTPGSWPAFWGLYDGWPPEADIMEYPLTTNNGTSGFQNNQYNTNFHYKDVNGNNAAGAGKVSTGQNLGDTGWHTFGMDWTAGTSVSFYFDGSKVASFNSSEVAEMQSMYMILDYAVGGWPGTPSTTQWPVGWTDRTAVDYVRVYQKNANGDAANAWKLNGGGSFATGGNWTLGTPKYGNQVAGFGRVGTAAAATVSMPSWTVVGGLAFSGGSDGTTAYTIGNATNAVQLASTGQASVSAAASSTVNQIINAKLELWSDTVFRNDMTGGQLLVANGVISGNGAMIVDGVGTTYVAGNNTYSGGTIVGSAAGPAVLRAAADNALGTAGVVIGASGNGTTARLEITGNSDLPNAIDLRGRTNDTVAVRSLGGTNVLSGTISANVGGSVYQIQSDAGLLSLTGADGAGVALTSAATGSRTFTLQGQGDGAVGGRITNGNAAVGIAKTQAGTWTLSNANTYTGGTTVTAGTLVADNDQALGVGFVTVSGPTAALRIAAGHDVGRLTGLTVANGGTLDFAGTGSSLSLDGGTFSLNGLTVDLNNAFDAAGTYTLIDGTAGGTIGQVAFTGVDTNQYNYALNVVNNDAVLSVTSVPEPATAGVVILAAAGLIRRRRAARA